MNLKSILTASVIALTPVAAFAAPLDPADPGLTTFDIESNNPPSTTVVNVQGLADAGTLLPSLTTGDALTISTVAGGVTDQDGEFDFSFSPSPQAILLSVTLNTIDFNIVFGEVLVEIYDGTTHALLGSTTVTQAGTAFDIILNNVGSPLKINYVWEKPVSQGSFDSDLVISNVPVPAGILLMGTALAGFGVMRRRKQRA